MGHLKTMFSNIIKNKQFETKYGHPYSGVKTTELLHWDCREYKEEWFKDGQRHCEDGPAITYSASDNTWTWYKNGLIHRDGDEPADSVCNQDERGWPVIRTWYKNGEIHRDNGPAVVKLTNDCKSVLRMEWWQHGKLHREDGPAIEVSQIDESWYFSHGSKSWYINGEKLTEAQFKLWQEQNDLSKQHNGSNPAALDKPLMASSLKSKLRAPSST